LKSAIIESLDSETNADSSNNESSLNEDEENLTLSKIDNDDELEETVFKFLSRKRKKAVPPRYTTIEGDFGNSDDSDNNRTSSDDEHNENDPINNDESSNNYEDYSHPIIDDLLDLLGVLNLPKQDRIVKILIWIMKFRSSFKLPNTAIEVLIKFVKIILEECGGHEYESFPESLYSARRTLGLVDQFVSFAACQKCHKLYKKENVMSEDKNTIMRCSHVEYPNSATKRSKQCQTLLGKKIS